MLTFGGNTASFLCSFDANVRVPILWAYLNCTASVSKILANGVVGTTLHQIRKYLFNNASILKCTTTAGEARPDSTLRRKSYLCRHTQQQSWKAESVGSWVWEWSKQSQGKFFESSIVCVYFVQRAVPKERHLEVLELRVRKTLERHGGVQIEFCRGKTAVYSNKVQTKRAGTTMNTSSTTQHEHKPAGLLRSSLPML